MTPGRLSPLLTGIIVAAVLGGSGCDVVSDAVAPVEWVQVGAPAGRGLNAAYVTGNCEELRGISVEETPTQVEVTVTVRKLEGPCTLAALIAHVRYELAAPLGNRPVIDASSGTPVSVGT